jgi:hypothetical protein
MKSWREENWRGRLRMIAFALTPVTVLVLIAVGLTALALYRWFGHETDRLSGRKTYVFQMGRYPWSLVSRTPLNSLGFPDDEFVNIPKGACTHVVFVGDSFTFGDGVDRDENWVSLVRTWTARRFPDRCLRMFNIGERASTIEQQAKNLDKTWELLQPDLVILSQYQNDLTDLTKRGFAGRVTSEDDAAQRNWRPPSIQIPLVGASIVKWLSYHSTAIMSMQGIHYDILERWSVLADQSNAPLAKRLSDQYAGMFDATVAKVRERGAQMGIIIFPSKFDVLAGHSPEEPYFLALAGKHRLPTLQLFATFDTQRRPYPFLMYDGHLNPHGNYLAAQRVMAWLFDEQPAPFTMLGSPLPHGSQAAAPDTAVPTNGR